MDSFIAVGVVFTNAERVVVGTFVVTSMGIEVVLLFEIIVDSRVVVETDSELLNRAGTT
jgi:hypothetical protein